MNNEDSLIGIVEFSEISEDFGELVFRTDQPIQELDTRKRRILLFIAVMILAAM